MCFRWIDTFGERLEERDGTTDLPTGEAVYDAVEDEELNRVFSRLRRCAENVNVCCLLRTPNVASTSPSSCSFDTVPKVPRGKSLSAPFHDTTSPISNGGNGAPLLHAVFETAVVVPSPLSIALELSSTLFPLPRLLQLLSLMCKLCTEK